nr:DUF3857 domain-containing protein [Massilia sp. Root335]
MISRYCALLIWMMVALLTTGGLARAGAGIDTGTDPSVIVERHVRHYVVEPDGTYRLAVDDARTLAAARAVPDHGRFTIRSSTTLDEIVSVEACTQKPDGRRIPVPPGAILSQDDGPTRATTIVFPAAATGDRQVVHYVVRRHTPPFPGQFDDVAVMPFLVHRNTVLVYDMPPSMPLHADAVGFVPMPGDSPPGRRRYQWRYVNGPNERIEADAVSVLDYGRRLVVSTVPDYPAFAAAFRAATAGKALPSPAISTLAHRLTAGLPDTRARVLALSAWVQQNIRPMDAGADAGAGAGALSVVPHAAATVLDTRRGDDRDRAALLEALLAAAGIASTPALVNGGNVYTLPDAPALGVLDHLIVYVPDIALFVDPAASVKAGDLPPALLGKPVLLLNSGTFAMTPVLQPQSVRTVAAVDIEHGTSTAERTVTGALAEPVRTVVRADGGGPWTNGSLATTDHTGSAVDAAVASLMRERARHLDFVCAAVDVEDETRLRLPQGLRVAALPGPASVITGGIFYRSTYTRENGAVLVRRRLTVRHGRATCTPADDRAMRPALARIRRDLRSRIVVAGIPSAPASRARVADKGVAPPARAQGGHGLVREVEAQVHAIAPGAVAAGPAGDLDEAATAEEAGRVRMRVDRHVARPQLAAGHVQQAVGQQRAADAGAVAIGPHQAEHEGAEVVKLGQFVAAEADDVTGVDGDEQRAVRIVQRGTQP